MRTSENGVELIKRFEGLELQAYQDIAGIWTIGYGHTGEDVIPGMKISARDAEELLKRDLKPREEAVSILASVDLNQNEFDALVSFVYNVGINGFRNSTARKRLNRNDRFGAADALTWWNKATVNNVLVEVRGLARRRAAEKALFLTPIDPPPVADPNALTENSRTEPVEDSPRRDNLSDSRTIQGTIVAGAAGVSAANLGRDSAEELKELEDNVENGVGLTLGEGSEEPAGGDAAAGATGEAGETATPPAAEAPSESAPTATPQPPAEAPAVEASPGAPSAAGETTATTEQTILRPSAHENHVVHAQIQLALMILIVISVIFTVLARIDDWFNYRR